MAGGGCHPSSLSASAGHRENRSKFALAAGQDMAGHHAARPAPTHRQFHIFRRLRGSEAIKHKQNQGCINGCTGLNIPSLHSKRVHVSPLLPALSSSKSPAACSRAVAGGIDRTVTEGVAIANQPITADAKLGRARRADIGAADSPEISVDAEQLRLNSFQQPQRAAPIREFELFT